MPYQNITSIRLQDPDKFRDASFRTTLVPKEDHWSKQFPKAKVYYIYAKKPGDKHPEIESVHIKDPKGIYSKKEIGDYVKEHFKNNPPKHGYKIEYSKEIDKSLFKSHPFESLDYDFLHIEKSLDFESSNLEMFEYDYKNYVLKVSFLDGAQYIYTGVPHSVINSFQIAESKGKFFHYTIKGSYPFIKIDPVPQLHQTDTQSM